MYVIPKLRWHGLIKIVAIFAGMTLMMPGDAIAQGLLGRLKNAVESEVSSQAEEQVREATRCALGNKNCSQNTASQANTRSQTNGPAGTPRGDHLVIAPYQGSELQTTDRQDYTEYNRVIGVEKSRKPVMQRLEGDLLMQVYLNPEGRSTLELIRNYRSALESRGFRVDYEHSGADGWVINIGIYNGMIQFGADVRYFTGKLKYNGGTAYVSILIYREGNGRGRTNIHVLETAEMDVNMVGVDPSAMASEMDRTGQINLQGIYFDTGDYVLKPQSGPALETVRALLAAQPRLRLDIVGHTDSSGDAASNQRLSERRAQSVRDALIAQGVAGDRLSARGMGSSQPIASNGTADGRTQNRRVMLVRQ